ncbi:MAG: hypothetical protein U0003_05580 [Vampirovibrionales bacterium]
MILAFKRFRAVVGVSAVEYALVAAVLVVPVIVAATNPQLQQAIRSVFSGSLNSAQQTGTLEVPSLGSQ